MRTVTVKIAKKEFTINEKRSRENAEWRKSLEVPFEGLAALLKGAPGTSLTDGESLSNLVKSVSGLLLGSIDKVIEFLIDYAPELEAVREEAYDSELLDAFTAVLGLAYPFGRVLDRITGIGSKQAKT